MKIKKQDHYLDWRDNAIVCRGCEKREVLELPISLSNLKKKMEAFKKEHKGCK